MKFRVKMTLCMLSLMAVLLGIGGSVLISSSFQHALERETEAARGAYQMVLNSVQVVGDFSGQPNAASLNSILEQMSLQNSAVWSSVRVCAGEELLYTAGAQAEDFRDFSAETSEGHCVVADLRDEAGGHFLQVSGVFSTAERQMQLDLAYNCSAIYEARAQQQRIYRGVFAVMALVCATLSYMVSWLLTKPLGQLVASAKRIASGELSSRSQIDTDDEIGGLSKEFDAMAEQIEEKVSQLEEAMTRQERFMGAFAHELKTPMTSIIGYADLLRAGRLGEADQTDAANYIFSEGKRLESLSLKLLDVLVTGNREVKLLPTSPARLIDELSRHLKPIYEKNGIALNWNYEPGNCMLEPDLVKSLVLNLIDNARKAIEAQGQIDITCQMLPDGCTISVSDDGRGIPSEAVEHLTEAFFRVDKSRARELGGAGLGLSLCAEIAKLHGGGIRFESEPGRGTCVTAELRGGRP